MDDPDYEYEAAAAIGAVVFIALVIFLMGVIVGSLI
jgi:hypothetical protein